MRCAASFAFSAESPVSYSISFSLAPPSALMPPALLMSSIAMRAPICSRMPWRAHGPDSGTSMAIFTSFGLRAGAARRERGGTGGEAEAKRAAASDRG